MRAAIVDTRKTIPGLRLAKSTPCAWAAGEPPHRPARRGADQGKPLLPPERRRDGGTARGRGRRARAAFIEIEVETLAQLAEALDAGAKMVLLDNMDLPTLRQAVEINAGAPFWRYPAASRKDGLRALAETGVDRISIGALTKDVKATDFLDAPAGAGMNTRPERSRVRAAV